MAGRDSDGYRSEREACKDDLNHGLKLKIGNQ